VIAAVHGVTVLPDLGPNNLDTLKLGPPLAFVLRPTSKRVEHGAGFTRCQCTRSMWHHPTPSALIAVALILDQGRLITL
jgi:hypothetical protein